jgi:hypothetical protein
VFDHNEVYCNFDDGFEFFGGTVNTSYLMVSHIGDDSFDYDRGYAGVTQFGSRSPATTTSTTATRRPATSPPRGGV